MIPFRPLIFVPIALVLISASAAFALVSDDFRAPNPGAAWTFVNPAGDSTMRIVGSGTSDSRLEISVPAGQPHDPWTAGNFAPRLVQRTANGDFTAEAKFDSPVTLRYQTQGIVVEGGPTNFLRFEFMSDGAGTRVFAASVLGTAAVVRTNRVIPATAPLYMQVRRTGNRWEQAWSPDGVNWSAAAAFDLPLTVTAAGVYAGNAGTSPPAHRALVDYFFDGASRIVPEDGAAAADVTPPRITEARTSPAASSLGVSWRTDESASASLAWGKTAAYELGTRTVPAATFQNVTLTGLQPDTPYQLRITARDASGNQSRFDAAARTLATATGCAVRPWYGSYQSFGRPGISQRWVNILGDVAGCTDLKSLSFRLNDGTPRPLSVGPDLRRLAAKGDFNVEIPRTDLRPGPNRVEIVATDNSGAQRSAVVTVDYAGTGTWPLPHHLSWSTFSSPAAAAQVVDGRWAIEGGGLRTTSLAYDRTVAVGDIGWSNYEALVPVTLLGMDPGGYNAISGAPGVGLILRWTGHFDWGGRQPSIGWKPVGATAWYTWDERLKLLVNDRLAAQDPSGRKLAVGRTYLFRVRAETGAGGIPAYKVKVWAQGETEPAAWTLSGTGYTSDPARGSLLLVAHHVDVRFGNVTLTPVASSAVDTTPPQISGISANPGTTTATVAWATNEPARGTLEYGTTTAYGSRVEKTTAATSQSASLTGLTAGKIYHYRIRATDAAGNSAVTPDRTFTTPTAPPPPTTRTAPRPDNFDGTALNTAVWTFVNPRGDARLTVSGGKASIAIPAGTGHDLWTGGNFAPRLLQKIGNGNFEMEAKFDSAVRSRYQTQGIVVEGGPGQFLRCEFQGDGAATRLFVATVTGTSASVKANVAITPGTSLYLRLRRAADLWTVSYSTNGATWSAAPTFTHPLAVTAAGVYGGNAGSPAPAHTAIVDYVKGAAIP